MIKRYSLTYPEPPKWVKKKGIKKKYIFSEEDVEYEYDSWEDIKSKTFKEIVEEVCRIANDLGDRLISIQEQCDFEYGKHVFTIYYRK